MNLFFFILFVSLGVVASILAKKLTVTAALTGGVLATALFFGMGWLGIALMGTFFLLGTMATSWGRRTKEQIGIAQENKGRRNAGQVIANGGAAAILGVVAIFFEQHTVLISLMIAAALSSATADTISSELGSIYGKRFYDIISFKKGRRGADGVVSIEGFLFGALGSSIIAVVYTAFTGWSVYFYWIVIAGTIGNLADSILGSTLERKGVLNNDAVNFLNTDIAAVFMLILIKL